jgi:hypothetical protein
MKGLLQSKHSRNVVLHEGGDAVRGMRVGIVGLDSRLALQVSEHAVLGCVHTGFWVMKARQGCRGPFDAHASRSKKVHTHGGAEEVG